MDELFMITKLFRGIKTRSSQKMRASLLYPKPHFKKSTARFSCPYKLKLK
jgi:hypothetical protein